MIVVPGNEEFKSKSMHELYSVTYSIHPGIQKTLAKAGKAFYWKGMTGDVREFVEKSPFLPD